MGVTSKHMKAPMGTMVGFARVRNNGGGLVDASRASKTVSGQSNSGDPKIASTGLKNIVIAVARKLMVVVRSQDGTGLFGFVYLDIYWQLE